MNTVDCALLESSKRQGQSETRMPEGRLLVFDNKGLAFCQEKGFLTLFDALQDEHVLGIDVRCMI